MAAVKLLVLCAACVAVAGSCGIHHRGAAVPFAYEDGAEETEREEYGVLRRLEEDPLDPMTARPAELRSIPGFPEGLAERLIDERRRHGTARGLFDALTPPEQETLRRYEPYIELPGRKPLRFEAWCTADRPGPGDERRDDIRVACRSDRFLLNSRYRSGDIHRLYISGSLPNGYARLHGGDLSADLAMGLCFSSHVTTYPFSSGYHVPAGRSISSATSLFDASLRGGAGEIWAGPARVLLLGGRLCSYSDGRLDAEGPAVRCARLALSLRGCRAGGAVHTIEERGGGPIWSADLSWSGDRAGAAAEIAFKAGAWSGLWALSVRGKRSGMSLLIHDIHPGWNHPTGRSFYGAGRRRRGFSIVIERRFARRMHLLSAIERSDAGDPYEEKSRDLFRLECRWSGSSGSVKFSVKRRIERRSILIPFPPDGVQPGDEVTDSIHLLQRWRLSPSLRLRISCRGTFERKRSGYLLCPSVSVDRVVRATLSWALHRTIEGMPLIYCYERSLKGRYPWLALRGDGWRVALLVELPVGPFRFGASLAAQKGELHEGAVQLCIKL